MAGCNRTPLVRGGEHNAPNATSNAPHSKTATPWHRHSPPGAQLTKAPPRATVVRLSDRAPHDSSRWLFLGGTSVNGSAASPNGVPIIEIWGSSAGSDWSRGFEYLGVFSDHGLAMCDPELIIFPVWSPPQPCSARPLMTDTAALPRSTLSTLSTAARAPSRGPRSLRSTSARPSICWVPWSPPQERGNSSLWFPCRPAGCPWGAPPRESAAPPRVRARYPPLHQSTTHTHTETGRLLG